MNKIDDKTLRQMATVAKGLLAAAVGLLVVVHVYQLFTSKEPDRSGVLGLAMLHFLVFIYCCLLAAFAHLALKYKITPNNAPFRLTLSCALWWTAASTFIIFTASTIAFFALLGFVFGIFTFFLWINTARCMWRTRQDKPRLL